MKLPRSRFTVRRMMIAVAIVGVLFGFRAWMNRRTEYYVNLSKENQEETHDDYRYNDCGAT